MLIDGGSSDNFVHERLAKFLDLQIVPSPNFQVLGGNGEKLSCSGKCSNIVFDLQGNPFEMDLFVLPIQGVDKVLGVQWLKLLGNIMTNYKEPLQEMESMATVIDPC